MVRSLSVLCGQLLVVGLAGPSLRDDERRRLARAERGGVVLFRRNVEPGPDGLARLTDLSRAVRQAATAATSDTPPLVAIDQEGGRVMRLGPPTLRLPPMRALGDLDDPGFVRRVAHAQGRELRALGLTMSFAPVADVHTRPENPIIGDRAFASTPERVATLAGAFADGLSDAGILTCAKHFPGHGDTTEDSHLSLPRVDRDADGLAAVEIAPFAALATRPSIDAMMTAHVLYPALDPERPATLSPVIGTELLRGKLGFQGVLFSDDLEMKAIEGDVGDAAVRAVLAGCDALLVCSRDDVAERVHEALVHEAESNTTFRARCEEALGRFEAMRRKTPAVAPSPTDALAEALADSEAVARELERRLGRGAQGARS